MIAAGQWALGDDPDALVFGDATPIRVTEFDTGDPELSTADVNLVGEDGTTFGRDTKAGRVITCSVVVNDTDLTGGRDDWRRLQAAWNAEATRATPAAVLPLRMYLPGSNPVRVFGRPRKSAPSSTAYLRSGVLPLELEFAAVDHRFYADVADSVALDMLPDFGGGLTWPIDWPIDWGTPAPKRDVLVNVGDTWTWPVITFIGPIANPTLTWTNAGQRIGLTTTLGAGQSVTIDTQPGQRTALYSSGGSAAGYLTGARLAEFTLAPGPTVASFTGTDLTGTARCVVAWRTATTTP